MRVEMPTCAGRAASGMQVSLVRSVLHSGQKQGGVLTLWVRLRVGQGAALHFHYERSIELQKLQVFGHLVYELHRALRRHQHIANMGRGCSPGPIPSTVVEPAAICVLPLGEGLLAKHGW